MRASPSKPLSAILEQNQERAFIKMHGLGNHFVIVDGRDARYQPTMQDVVRICDIHTGVGADQLLVIDNPGPDSCAKGVTARLRILNVDGREAGACGNASRCVAWLLLEESASDTVTIETLAGLLVCTRAGHQRVSVNMGPISSDWTHFPLREPCDTMHVPVGNGILQDPLALFIGNPHLIFFVDDIAGMDLSALAPAIQNDALFPQQINVGVVEILDASHILLSVYERPGILTQSCGSGACVAAMAMRLRGHSTQRHFRVEMPGGSVDVELLEDNSAVMTGPVDYCFQGTLAFTSGEPC